MVIFNFFFYIPETGECCELAVQCAQHGAATNHTPANTNHVGPTANQSHSC